MKKTILMILLCIFSSLTMRAGDYQYLVFTLSNGTTQAVTATDLSIAFTGDNLVATSGNETLATLPLSTLASMEFSTDGTTGISQISADQLITDDLRHARTADAPRCCAAQGCVHREEQQQNA